MINDYWRSMFMATSMNTHHVWSMIIDIAMNIDRLDQWSKVKLMNTDRQWSLIINDIAQDQWSLLWNAVDHTWSVLINGLYREPYPILMTAHFLGSSVKLTLLVAAQNLGILNPILYLYYCSLLMMMMMMMMIIMFG